MLQGCLWIICSVLDVEKVLCLMKRLLIQMESYGILNALCKKILLLLEVIILSLYLYTFILCFYVIYILFKNYINYNKRYFIRCAQCFRPFPDGIFYEFEGYKYCEHDFHVLFAPCCEKCGKLF